ncbi:MAG TPA: septum site-determining protein MinC [Kofleriaceae bacterium]
MSQSPSVAIAGSTEDSPVEPAANVSLKGTTRGLEILISGTPSAVALGARLTELLAEAPGFFAGSHARIAIDGVLPVGALACLEEVAARFELRIVELGPVTRRSRGELAPVPSAAPVLPPIPPLPAALAVSDDVPRPELAEAGSIAGDVVGTDGAQPSASGDSAPGEGSPIVIAGDAAAKVASAPVEAGDAAGKAASAPVEAGDAAGKAASAPVEAGDAAGKAALASMEPGDAAAKAALASKEAGDAAAKAASAPSSVAPGDPGLLAALAAVLVAAGGGDPAAAAADEGPVGPRLVIGPIRSGRIVDHTGHLIVIGDVNPGAEVRAEGSIIVLGRLRGVAHAAIGRDAGCIIALSLQPQQLRIGRMVARAGDADRPSGGAEIAYATGETIVVERFLGRLPSGLAASM